ncbi:MAG: nuclear transport factor 2 family protein [Candidatus Eremiobacteraeota bacterium]|nr:nuclear transport factor 2 family protein [Candidatus Eremiobacteraeota bacterium]
MPVVHAIYEAIHAGNVDGVLSHLAQDVSWRHNSNLDEVPWHQARSGHNGVRRFFEEHHAATEHAKLIPHGFSEGPGIVAVRLRTEYVIKRNGARIDSEEVHWWQFDSSGKVKSLTIFEDSAAFAVAVEQ